MSKQLKLVGIIIPVWLLALVLIIAASADDADISAVVSTAPEHSTGSSTVDQTAFQFATEVATEDIYYYQLPFEKTTHNKPMVIELSLTFPEGIEVKVKDDQQDSAGDNNVRIMPQTNSNTWKFDFNFDADSDISTTETGNETSNSGDVIVISVQTEGDIDPIGFSENQQEQISY